MPKKIYRGNERQKFLRGGSSPPSQPRAHKCLFRWGRTRGRRMPLPAGRDEPYWRAPARQINFNTTVSTVDSCLYKASVRWAVASFPAQCLLGTACRGAPEHGEVLLSSWRGRSVCGRGREWFRPFVRCKIFRIRFKIFSQKNPSNA